MPQHVRMYRELHLGASPDPTFSGRSRKRGRCRHAMTKWPHHPNLRKKPHAPSKGRGPVQRAIRRVFMASGAEVLNSTDIYDWAHGRRRFGRRKSMPFGVYSRTLRTLRAMCEPVGRAPTIGRPWLWRLRNSHEDTR
jgi:hypothetical protein